MLTLEEIRNIEFSRGRGYRAEEVDDFIDECVSTIEQLVQENNTTNQKMKMLADKVAEYRNDEDSIRAALLSAQRTGDTIIRDAQAKAKDMLESAQQDAQAARDALLADVQREQEELARVRQEVSEFKGKLLAMYKEHLSVIKMLPEETEEAPEPQADVQEPTPAETVEDDSDMVVVSPVSEELIQTESDEEMTPLSRFSDLKFGNDYDIHQDDDEDDSEDETVSRGLFRKKK